MNWFRQLRLGTQLIISYMLIAVIAAFIGLFGNYQLHQLDDKDTFLYEKTTVPIGYMAVISQGFERIAANIPYLQLERDPRYIKMMEDLAKKVEAPLKDYRKTLIDAEDEKLYNALLAQWGKWLSYLEQVKQLARDGKYERIQQLQDGEGRKVRLETRAMIEKVVELNLKAAKETSDGNSRFASRTSLIINVVIAVGVLLAVAIGLLITALITRQLGGEPRYVSQVMREVSGGNLTVQVSLKPGDNDSMLASVAAMIAALREVAGQSLEAANQVSVAADQIAEANQSFSQKITEQAAAVEETTASLEEMGATTRSTADNSREANTLARNGKTVAEQGMVVMEDTISAMSEINRSSTKIASISDVIGEIAFQTNLLALNAAVEAARAGEHGKGFAVVASEIRSLAGRTSQSAKEITALIEDSAQKTSRGVKLAEELSAKLEEIGNNIKKVTDLMDEVAAASTEQSTGINQINTAMGQVDQATQANASLVEETSASAEELAAQARALLEVISFFTVEETSRTGRVQTASPVRLGGQIKAPVARQPQLAAPRQQRQDDFSDF